MYMLSSSGPSAQPIFEEEEVQEDSMYNSVTINTRAEIKQELNQK